ncbi:MAG: alpha-amylase family glycosyl hydrolase, partial [Bacilli bacterium]
NLISKDQRFLDDTFISAYDDGRKYYTDGPSVHEYLKEMNEHVFALYPHSLSTGEMSSTTIEHAIRYTNPLEHELNMVFNFHHLKVDYLNNYKWTNALVDFTLFKDILFEWQVKMAHGNGWNALFLTNHDQPRALSRFGDAYNFHYYLATMLASMTFTMQGTPYIYQGEEFGMLNPQYESLNQYRDVESLNNYQIMIDNGMSKQDALAILNLKSRDNARSPLQWNNQIYNGFSKVKPWISLGQSASTINLENDLNNDLSIFKYYQQLISLRKANLTLCYGLLKPIDTSANIMAYYRHYQDNASLLVIHNLSSNIIINEVDLPFKSYSIIISNYQNEIYPAHLNPYETILIKCLD